MLKFCPKFFVSSIVVFTFITGCYAKRHKIAPKATLPQKSIAKENPKIVPQQTTEIPCWPTSNQAFFNNEPLEKYIQPTASGNVISGTYGCVRNNGRRFHEGIDIKSIQRNRRNIPQDKVFAVLSGTIVYINRRPGLSSYGQYIVLEHTDKNLHFYTLYAHLANIEKNLTINQSVKQHQQLGQMGNTACFRIPLYQAHLHFEIGLKLGNKASFAQWYASQKFPTSNKHGQWNGLNLTGLNPLDFFKSKQNFTEFLKNQPIAFTLVLATSQTHDFILRNPALLTTPLPKNKIYGWEIAFNWVGAPLKWTPITHPLKQKISLKSYDKNELTKLGNRHTLEFDKKGHPFIGTILQRQLFELFREKFQF